MKYIANIISGIRIVLSISLLFLINHTAAFILTYILCGLSDILDGYIARKTNTQSIVGARLDSIADFMMYGVIVYSMLTWTRAHMIVLLSILISIFLLRILNIIIAAYKYHAFVMLHTWGNKLAGLLVFTAPLLFVMWQSSTVILWIGFICGFTAIEETVIHLTSKEVNLNRRTIFLDR